MHRKFARIFTTPIQRRLRYGAKAGTKRMAPASAMAAKPEVRPFSAMRLENTRFRASRSSRTAAISRTPTIEMPIIENRMK